MIQLSEHWSGMPESFIEGALLAANICPVPLSPETWLEILVTGGVVEPDTESEISEADKKIILSYLEQQYNTLMRHEYVLPQALDLVAGREKIHAIFAEGFLAVWPLIEPHWQQIVTSDGTRRMLSGLVTCILFLYEEETTRAQMEEAGMTKIPEPEALYAQFAIMMNEVALAANEKVMGLKAKALNPFKSVGRNDLCLCGSGKKYKKCCLKYQ